MKHSARSIVLAIVLIFGSQSSATAGKLKFSDSNELVFFQGPIILDEIDDILSQLTDKKPKLMLLDSIGGNIYGALQFAKYVRKNQMDTWISEGSACASACALVFLAGIERTCEGKLLVHQFLPAIEYENEKIRTDVAWISIQKVIGETITLLNTLDTPRFVFERIFTSPNLYEFTEAELLKICTVVRLDKI